MAQPYQLTANEHTILRVADNAHIPDDPANRDWQEYQVWLDDGNIPDPAPEPPAPPEPEPVDLPPVMPTDLNHATPKGYVDTEILKLHAEMVPFRERVEALEARMMAVERRQG